MTDLDAVPPGGLAADARPVVAAFDFDGTLTVRSQLEPFVLQAGGLRRSSLAVARSLVKVVQLPRSSAHRDAAKAAVLHRVFEGIDEGSYAALGQSFALHVLASKMRADSLARLRWHQEHGHSTVIVSASLSTYLDPIGTRLGIDGVLCTTLESAGGKLTGRLVGANVRGTEKARRLDAWLTERFGTTEVTLWAYGDTAGDRAMLERADHATWVKRQETVPQI
ncbi:MAG: HAD-IB family hydrolase [Acidimicrobiia bacterium]